MVESCGKALKLTVNSIKLETGLRPNSAGVPYILLLRIEAMRFPTFRLLLYIDPKPPYGSANPELDPQIS